MNELGIDQTPTYKLKLTRKQMKDREKILLRSSPLYKEVKSRGISHKKLAKLLRVRRHGIYDVFSRPLEKLTLERVLIIHEFLGDHDLQQILLKAIPVLERYWYELDDWEGAILLEKLEKLKK
jgi:predicted transcriptional regulator